MSEYSSSPRPPTMIARHMNATPPVFRPQPQNPYGHPPSPGPFAAYSTYPANNFNDPGMSNGMDDGMGMGMMESRVVEMTDMSEKGH